MLIASQWEDYPSRSVWFDETDRMPMTEQSQLSSSLKQAQESFLTPARKHILNDFICLYESKSFFSYRFESIAIKLHPVLQ